MRIFGLTIERQKQAVSAMGVGTGGWSSLIREPFAGAWQRNLEKRPEHLLTHNALFACVTLIASDIGKLRIKLVEQNPDGIWEETEASAFSPVLRKPNRYQNRIKFLESWVISKLTNGNTYILKERDNRGVVTDLYVLNHDRCRPLVAPDGSVYYQLGTDNLAGIETSLTLPASEIIHDIMAPLFHPLCGVTPITACALPAAHGLKIQEESAAFFANGARPSGVLTAPGTISQEDAARVKAYWEAKFSNSSAGHLAVLGDGMKYAAMTVTAVDSQLLELLKWTSEQVCTAFHVPPYMIGVGTAPTYNNIEALNQQYYAQCLQSLIESIELCLDEGLGLTEIDGKTYGTELDLDGLLRMDTAGQVKAAIDGIGGGLFTPNEGRRKFDLKKVKGGDTPYLQMQNFSLEALNRRDKSDDPFALAPKRDQNTPTPAEQAAAEAAANAKPPAKPPAKSDEEISRYTKDVADALQRKLAA